MIKRIIIFTIIITSLFFININTKAEINKIDEKVLSINNINTIIESNDNIIILKDNSVLLKYDLNYKLITTKKIGNLTNSTLKKYEDDYVLAGIQNNILNIYLINSNLKIKKSFKIYEMIKHNCEIKITNFNDKIYVTLYKNNLIYNNKIYEIKENEIIDHLFSEFDKEDINNILKESYTLMNETINNYDTFYTKAAREEDYNILYNNKEIEVIKGNYILNKELETEIKDLKLIDNAIYVLHDNKLISYDYELNKINEYNICNECNAEKMIITSNKVYLLYRINGNQYIDLYDFNYTITNKDDDKYGTVEIPKTATPGEKVLFDIKPNSGYEINKVTFLDADNEEINIKNNSFVMPESNVRIVIDYTEVVKNPETSDKLIIIIIVFSIISLLIVIKIYKKVKWIKMG